jgi:ligand-binding SRPBCC domain-containing protein
MPQYTTTLDLARPVEDVFALFAAPAQLVCLAPPELRLELLEGPERVQLGSVLRWQARRAGVRQFLVTEITAFEENGSIVEKQKQGPFARWEAVRRFAPHDDGTRLIETVEFEPPRGVLGLLLNAKAIGAELERMFAYRELRLREMLA